VNIIALSGKKRAGKDTLFGMLRDILGTLRVVRVAFADPLKAEVAAALGVPISEIEARKEYFRVVLQFWGEWRCSQDPLYWVNRMRDRLEALRESETCDLAVITDCRRIKEVELVRDMGGHVYRIRSLADNNQDNHVTETELDDFLFDGQIFNTGTLEQLKERASEIAGYYHSQYAALSPWQRSPAIQGYKETPSAEALMSLGMQ